MRFSFKHDETHPACIELKKVLAEQIDFLYSQGVTDFYTGCVLDIDLWAREAVLTLMEQHPEIKLHCVVPFAARIRNGHRSSKPGIMPCWIGAAGFFWHRKIYSKDCYYIRNRYLADHADIVLAIYDMNENKRSGTGYTVHYAHAQGKDIIAIDPDNFHVSCSSTETQKIF